MKKQEERCHSKGSGVSSSAPSAVDIIIMLWHLDYQSYEWFPASITRDELDAPLKQAMVAERNRMA